MSESLKVEEKVQVMKPVMHAWPSEKNANLHNFHIPALVENAYFENHGRVDARIPQAPPTPDDAKLIAALHGIDGVVNVALWPGLASLEFAPTEMRPTWLVRQDVMCVLRDHMAWINYIVIDEKPPAAKVESREYQLASFDPLGLRRPLASVR